MELAGLTQWVLEQKDGWDQNTSERRLLKQEEDAPFTAAGMGLEGTGRDRETVFAGKI